MAITKISEKAKSYNFDVSELDLSEIKNTGYKKYDLDVNGRGQGTLTMIQDSKNRIELHGTFNTEALLSENIVKGVKTVDTITVTERGTVTYTISGLDLTGADLKNGSTFAAFLEEQSFNITGNASSNVLKAYNKVDQLFGAGGNDKLYGLGGNDKLDGGDGNDTLDGGTGKDSLKGGNGNDIYVIDKYDSIVETKKGGTDTISADLTIDLDKFDFIENLVLTGTKAINGFGDAGSNVITGNSGVNTLDGGRGVDMLKGGAGADLFHFVKGGGKDTILDFDATGKGQDRIDLDDYGVNLKFAKLDIDKLGRHDVDIDFGNGDHLILKNVSVKDIDASDFLF